jgi:hypothetical protein
MMSQVGDAVGHDSIRPTQEVCAITDTAQGEKRLFNLSDQAILTSDGRPLVEFWIIQRDHLQKNES